MISTILFDWAGVLTTGKYTQSILDELKQTKNILIEEIYHDFDNLVSEIMRGNLTFHDFVAKVNKDFNLDTDMEQMKKVFNDAIHPNYATIEYVKALKPHYILAILSDNDAVTVSNLKNHHSEMLDLFDKKYFSFDLGCTKPDPQIFQKVIKDLRVQASECLFTDDKLKNVEGARKVGLNAIQFININQLKNDFAKLGITQTIV